MLSPYVVLSRSFSSVNKQCIDFRTDGFVGSNPSSPPSARARCGYDFAISKLSMLSSSSPGTLYFGFLFLLLYCELVPSHCCHRHPRCHHPRRPSQPCHCCPPPKHCQESSSRVRSIFKRLFVGDAAHPTLGE